MRVKDHAILGKMPEVRWVEIEFDGKTLPAIEGEPVAAALLAQGINVFRRTPKTGQPRGIFCAIGRCTDCVMTVDGVPNVRTCVEPVRDGMKVQTQIGRGQFQELDHANADVASGENQGGCKG